ncbi:unnamed protein product [Linum trigynum]|uniref:Uncharacterized protein n=1 Tax=Linum trigynum TaxID=586398 RepID=A0AAV2GJX8_9ROSI
MSTSAKAKRGGGGRRGRGRNRASPAITGAVVGGAAGGAAGRNGTAHSSSLGGPEYNSYFGGLARQLLLATFLVCFLALWAAY